MKKLSFPERLKEVREDWCLTQTKFGAMGGVGRISQSHYETGARKPNTDYLEALASHGVDVTYLITGVLITSPFVSLSSDEIILIERFRVAGRTLSEYWQEAKR